MLRFYCPNVNQMTMKQQPGTIRSPKNARHFFNDMLRGVPVITPLLPWGCEACGCSDRLPLELIGLSLAQTGGTGNFFTGIRMNGTLSAARVRPDKSSPRLARTHSQPGFIA